MVNFNPSWISDANFDTKSMFEDKKLLFPEAPVGSTHDSMAKQFTNMNTLKSQLLSIVVTQTSTGKLHFDTPTKGQDKDIYSALILAASGARKLETELEDTGDPILFNAGGMVRSRRPGSTFGILDASGNPMENKNYLGAAVLKKKMKWE
jgi:hypothetical protein